VLNDDIKKKISKNGLLSRISQNIPPIRERGVAVKETAYMMHEAYLTRKIAVWRCAFVPVRKRPRVLKIFLPNISRWCWH